MSGAEYLANNFDSAVQVVSKSLAFDKRSVSPRSTVLYALRLDLLIDRSRFCGSELFNKCVVSEGTGTVMLAVDRCQLPSRVTSFISGTHN